MRIFLTASLLLLCAVPVLAADFACGDATRLTRYIASADPSTISDPTCTKLSEADTPAQRILLQSNLPRYFKILDGLIVMMTQAERDVVDAAVAASVNRVPVVSGAGTNPQIQGNERGGRIRVGTGGTLGPILLTWAHALNAEPQCWVQNETDTVDVRTRATQTGLQIRAGVMLVSGVVLKYGCQAE